MADFFVFGVTLLLACEQQRHFRSSLLSLRREATTGNVSAVRRLLCCRQLKYRLLQATSWGGWGGALTDLLAVASIQLPISSRSKQSLKQAKRALMARDRASDKVARSEKISLNQPKNILGLSRATLQRKSKKDTKLCSSRKFILGGFFVSSETVSNPQMHGP